MHLDLHRGRVHGVLGENGAGKSTLMRILIGLTTPDAGHLEIDGEHRHIGDPLAAAALGIAMVHQHFSLVDQLSVWENVVLGEVGRIDRRAARRLVEEVGERYGLVVDPDAEVGELSAGMRQRVEIIKCLRGEPDIVVFDEPTSVLTPQESEQLFGVLRLAVEREHKAVALVSHKLDEILHATDEVTILRRGRVVDSMPTAGADAGALARAMVGRDVSLRSGGAALGLVDLAERGSERAPAGAAGGGDGDGVVEPALAITGLRCVGEHGQRLLDGIDLWVAPGEILGIAGVEGNGQVPLVEVLSSLRRADAGSVRVAGEVIATGRAGAMGAAGVAVIPEDRHDSGCVMELSVAENLALADPGALTRRGLLDRRSMRARAEARIDEYDIACTGPWAPLSSLSGGNQQRVVVARELSTDPTVLVAAQPTRGLDVGAIEFMNDKICEVAAAGVAVLLLSSELEEVLHLAHRIAVLHAGRVVGTMTRAEVDPERLGLLMGGVAA